jgi:hypothetical protein
MMLSHVFMRHRHKGQDIVNWHQLAHSKEYIDVLQRVNDNTDGPKGAFSIRNIARMSLVYDKFPGEWHGPGSISMVLRDLNRLYQPCIDLQIVHFSDGLVYFDKVRAAGCKPVYNWINKKSDY